jgi:ketosteroid isomerase-like protein
VAGVTHPDVARLEGVYRNWSRGEFFADNDLYAPEIEFVLSDEFPDGGTYRGYEELQEGFLRWLRAWDDYRVEADGIERVPDGRIVVMTRYIGRGKGSGVEVSRQGAHIWWMREGRAVRQEIYATRDEALEELGRGRSR